MSVLHAYFTLRKQREFQRALEQSKGSGQPQSQSQSAGQHQYQLSTSGGGSRSWTQRHSPLAGCHASAPSGSATAIDVNARDAFGRTVLHAACSSVDPASLEFVRLLLAHPAINPNAQDQESHWTPLHRALYVGNIAAAYVRHVVSSNVIIHTLRPREMGGSTYHSFIAIAVIRCVMLPLSSR